MGIGGLVLRAVATFSYSSVAKRFFMRATRLWKVIA
jgi:hypothetical protein